MASPAYGSLPFHEQIRFFRHKLNLPSQSWTDLWQQGHDHGFVVAGANRDALVADFRQAVDKAIANGTTLEEFRRDFDNIVARHGWSYHGSRGWRSQVIYNTNLRTSYAAGRYHQLQAVKHERPYWEWHHTPVQNPRELHVEWDGLTLHADDDWWTVHYPPDGWGCQCVVYSRSHHDLARKGKSGPDTAPPVHYRTVTVGQNGPAPRTVRVPEGVDPGFAYAPGATAWSRAVAEDGAAIGRVDPGAFDRATPGDWQSAGRPRTLPAQDPPGDQPAVHEADADATARDAIGGDTAVYRPGGAPVAVNAKVLTGQTAATDLHHLGLLVDTLTSPTETWAAIVHKDGYYTLRLMALKTYTGDNGTVIAQAGNGVLERWQRTSDASVIQSARAGILLTGGSHGS